jgi:hypothetical protein
MKRSLILLALSALTIASAAMADDYAAQCVEHFNQTMSDQGILNCGQITNADQLGCILNFTTLSDDGILACTNVNNDYALACVQHFNNTMSNQGIVNCGEVRDENALACVRNFSDLSDDGIANCATL